MSEQELVKRPTPPPPIVNPETGELLNLRDAGDDDLATYIADCREFEGKLRLAKRAVGDELLGRMDRNASWTLRAGPYKVSGRSPQPETEWDTAALDEVLDILERDDLISAAARVAAVEPVKTLTTHRSGINAIRKSLAGNQAALELIDECEQEIEKPRPMPSVKRETAL